MAKDRLRVATCQFPVSGSVRRNERYIVKLMRDAKRQRAEIVHFSECALSGYAGVDHTSLDGYDWDELRAAGERVAALGKSLGMWVVLGSMHQLSDGNRPHNCLYLLSPEGRVKDRYDKRFCMPGDLEHYTPGDRFVTFMLNGVKCALLICYDVRFGEIYRELAKLKVQMIFQSFYNARQKERSVHTDIMRQSMQCRAASNYFWVSMTNSCAFRAPYPSCLIRPDGKLAAQMEFHRTGVMVHTVDATADFYDAAGPYRRLAMRGVLHSGKTVDDPRSRRRTGF